MRALFNDERGASMAELAIASPILMMAIGGFIQLCMIVNAKHMVDLASFQATRAVIVSSDMSEAKNAAATGLLALYGDPAGSLEVGTLVDFAKIYATTQVTLMHPTEIPAEGLVPERLDQADDNLFRVRVVHGFRLDVPVIGRAMLRLLGSSLYRDADGNFSAFRAGLVLSGRLPLESEYVMRNQAEVEAGGL